MISKISFNVPKINFSNTNATSKNTLERSPKTDTVSFSGNCECPACNNELPEGLKETLDNKVFTFKKDKKVCFFIISRLKLNRFLIFAQIT